MYEDETLHCEECGKEFEGYNNAKYCPECKKIIKRRAQFIEELNAIINEIHSKLSGGKENMLIKYMPYCQEDELEELLKNSLDRDIKLKMTNVGPHKDDFTFIANDIDIRMYGSQGQQRTAALSLKLSEIEIVKKITKDKPVLLLDDVLSELDSNRQNYLLDSIGDIQTIITCTGLEDFVNDRFEINKIFKIENGVLVSEN